MVRSFGYNIFQITTYVISNGPLYCAERLPE